MEWKISKIIGTDRNFAKMECGFFDAYVMTHDGGRKFGYIESQDSCLMDEMLIGPDCAGHFFPAEMSLREATEQFSKMIADRLDSFAREIRAAGESVSG